jgi:hypothetical protein
VRQRGKRTQITAESLSDHQNGFFHGLLEAIRGFWSDILFLIANDKLKFT